MIFSPGMTSSSRFLLFCRPDVQRHDGAGEDDDVADRQDRQQIGNHQSLTVAAGADDRRKRRTFDDL